MRAVGLAEVGASELRDVHDPQLGHQRRVTSTDLVATAVVATAALSWIVSLRGADPASMTDLGLVSLLSPLSVSALLVLTGGFLLALRRGAPGWLLGLHVVVFVTLIHGTPILLYGTLRYAWAWKHVGIVEFITRTGAVDTKVHASPIYQAWPGFFAASAALTSLAGARNAIRIAMWAPLAFNLANFVSLRFLYRSLGVRRLTMWLATWLFFTTNWVGQDYFSPQAMAFVLYLMLLGVALRGFRRSTPATPVQADPIARRHALAMVLLLLATLASSHQITPAVTTLSLTGLVLFRQIRGWYLPAFAGGLTALWAVTVGRGVLDDNLSSILESFGRPMSNAEETFHKTSTASSTQLFVSMAGRLVVLAMVVLAAIGLFRLWRARRIDPAVLVIVGAPAALPLLTEFGGEVIFRVFLFAGIGLALLAAEALLPPIGTPRPRSGRRSAAPELVDAEPWAPLLTLRANSTAAAAGPTGWSTVGSDPPAARTPSSWSVPRTMFASIALAGLLAGFIVAYYGKDQQYYFSKAEVAAATWLAENAPRGSLIVEGTRNYPNRFLNYEMFTYVTIAREPQDSRERVVRDPVGRLEVWLSNDRYPNGYIIITRSMKVDLAANGPMPAESLDRIEEELRASPRFRVAFENADSVIFTLADGRTS